MFYAFMSKNKNPPEDDGIIIADETSKFWIYVMSPKLFKEFESRDDMYLACYVKEDINVGDIIFIYIKRPKTPGFIGVCKVCTALQFNTKNIKVFKDHNLNRSIFELESATVFNDSVHLSKLIEKFDPRNPKFKNELSFRKNYLADCDIINPMEVEGPRLLKMLFNGTSYTGTDSEKSQSESSQDVKAKAIASRKSVKASRKSVKASRKSVKASRKSVKAVSKVDAIKKNKGKNTTPVKKIDNDSSQSYKSVDTSCNDEIILSSSDDLSDHFEVSSDSSCEDDDKNYDNDYNDDDDDDDDDDEDEENNELVPIMWIPCSDFIIPNTDDEDDIINYLVNHYKVCKLCEKTNNNNLDPSSILDNATLEFEKIEDKKDKFLEAGINAYHEAIGLYPPKAKKIPFVRFQLIDNEHRYYEGCILITWII
jgi:hypothetical protein